jgi:hypothetical protein
LVQFARRWLTSALERRTQSLLLAEMNIPTFDGHLNESNMTEEVFDGIHTAQETDSGIQA